MTKIIKKIAKWFTPSTQSALEAYIVSKRPTNAAEVEFWTRHYETAYAWGRGL